MCASSPADGCLSRPHRLQSTLMRWRTSRRSTVLLPSRQALRWTTRAWTLAAITSSCMRLMRATEPTGDMALADDLDAPGVPTGRLHGRGPHPRVDLADLDWSCSGTSRRSKPARPWTARSRLRPHPQVETMILFLGFRVKAATPGKPGAPGKSDHAAGQLL